ncbi:MAG: DUF192 domain-containing protein [Proteobacteria bacterium]|nr:DUF192 domain-containing protein [Pseudomonadota bacterium]NBY21006.1 DUF192 domain-containing protein [bacterium]
MKTTALKKNNQILIPRVQIAQKFFERFFGLMGRKNINEQDTIVFPNCNSIHTFFMSEKIDVIFVSATGVVTNIFYSLKPWKLLLPQKKAVHCIEMASESSRVLGISEGDSLSCEGVF